jgi:transglutaminase-like putative cysteine protease
VSTSALGVVTVVTAVGMGQLFEGHSYLVPVVLVAVLAHGLCYGLRRSKRFPPVLLGPVCFAAVALVSTWLVFGQATALGAPDLRTWHAISHALAQARVDITVLRSPVPATPGFVWMACLGIGLAAVLADVAVFRLGAPVEGVLPAFAIFLFTAGLGSSGGRSVMVALWLAAVLGYFLVIEIGRRTARAQWLALEPVGARGVSARGVSARGVSARGVGARGVGARGVGARGVRAILPAGGALVVVAVLGAVLIGPAIPGARAASLLSAAAGSGDGASRRTTISPLVNIKSELLDPSNASVFRVSAPQPSYWRLTSLDSFSGTTWSADATYRPVGTTLPSTPGPEPETLDTQTFQITGLDQTWLPAAFQPVALSGVSGAAYNRASASIIASRPTYAGMTYTVTSELPDFTAAELDAATVATANPGLAHYLALPSSVPSSVIRLARRVTAGDTTPYAKALALQNYFRDNFAYSLDVPPSDSNNALVNFLFHTHEGYCQQFAGAYAVLARVVGLPSRVAVGFTEGQQVATGVYRVEALNAHAWPEVEMGAYGWVPFEPTPGRGEPGAAAYTGVAPAQANPVASTAGSVTSPTLQRTPTSIPAPSAAPKPHAPRSIPTSTPAHARRGLGVLADLLVALGGMLAVLALLSGIGANRRRRRWATASSGPSAALAAFADVSELLARAGQPRHPAETFESYALRVAPSLPPETSSDLLALAGYAEFAAYAPWVAHDNPSDVRQLRELGNRIIAGVRTTMPKHLRAADVLDPRPTRHSSPPAWRQPNGTLLVRDPPPVVKETRGS